MMKKVKIILLSFISEKAALVYIFLFGLSIGVATFIENDFGTDAAQKWCYQASWFNLLLFLFGLSNAYLMFKYQLWQRKRYSALLFHFSILIILLGSAITRFYGFEGTVAIREGQSQQQFLTTEAYLGLKITTANGQQYQDHKRVLFSSIGKNEFDHVYHLENRDLKIELIDFIPNAVERFITDSKATQSIKIVFPGASGRQEVWLPFGEKKVIFGTPFCFSRQAQPDCINILQQGDSLFFKVAANYEFMEMATQKQVVVNNADTIMPLHFRSLYQVGGAQFVFSHLATGRNLGYISKSPKIESNSLNAVHLKLSLGNEKQEVFLLGNRNQPGQPQFAQLSDIQLELSYGAIFKDLPFSLKLNNFELKRYPGTNSPSSFSSYVIVQDPVNHINTPFHIYMNHVLDHQGYRFFQSSYDQDEKGTYLSMNHDYWGSMISYFGYFLLTIGFVWNLLSKKSRFANLRKALPILLLFVGSQSVFGQTTLIAKREVPSSEHADLFSQLLVQDFNGRFKPLHTLNREILRKVYGNENFESYSADQVVLGMLGSSSTWVSAPIIKIGKHPQLNKILNCSAETKYLSYSDFFNTQGQYKLQNFVDQSSLKQDKDKNNFDKELLKLDERVSIVNMVMSGNIFKIIPLKNDPNNKWISQHDHDVNGHVEAQKWFGQYLEALHQALHHQEYSFANQLLADLDQFQRSQNPDILPSQSQRSWEIWLNKSHLFERLTYAYLLLGLCFLVFLFWQMFSINTWKSKLETVTNWFGYFFVVLHSLGLILRWYISERAPWSNGYESMIYIAWAVMLAGFLFARKSTGAKSATYILGAVMLFVAQMSFFSPEITPLEPVLNSYWLTIHVSMEAGSYGFLLLGGIIGMLNLILLTFKMNKHQETIQKQVKELTILNELILTAGIVMLSIGTFLGGVWANESWGRYWGWDAKETWALVSILVYALILHLRFIPRFNNFFVFNVASIFGFASIIMTYFGVNYYLSGLHSYAAGDPIPIPDWVYISVMLLTCLSIYAGVNFYRFWTKNRGLKI
jgi:cytochrome c-type biogenesis protein CcsB